MPTTDQFEAFDEYYVEAKGKIDDRIGEVLADKEEFATKQKMLAHSTRGGKRIRPVLTMLVGEMYDSPYPKTLNHAVIVEFIHNASLIADDRYDEDAMRRGAPTFHKVIEKLPFGKKGHKAVTGMSVMGANGLVALAYELARDPDVMHAMSRGLRHLVDGFFHEGLSVFDGVIGGGYERYIEINKTKTGGLFALAAWMPATYVDAPEEQIHAARKYGEATGILYQIADDMADGDIPSYVEDPENELEVWYREATAHVGDMPPGDREELLRVAPAWMVMKMFEQEEMLDEVDVGFLPTPVEK